MLKSDLMNKLSEKFPAIEREDIVTAVETVFESIQESLKRGERVEIRGLGSFSVRNRKAKEGRNPKSGAKVFVPEKVVPFFTVGKELRERVDGVTQEKPAAQQPAGYEGKGG